MRCVDGGVQGDRLFSQAHDDLFQYNFEKQRWGHVMLRPPKKGLFAEADAVAAADAQSDAAVSGGEVRLPGL